MTFRHKNSPSAARGGAIYCICSEGGAAPSVPDPACKLTYFAHTVPAEQEPVGIPDAEFIPKPHRRLLSGRSPFLIVVHYSTPVQVCPCICS